MERKTLDKETRAYLSEIGRRGGKKSRRKLSKREARAMAAMRWSKVKKEKKP